MTETATATRPTSETATRPAARVYPEALAGARESTRHLFVNLVGHCDFMATMNGPAYPREVDWPLEQLGLLSGSRSAKTAARSLAWLERRGLIERIDSGQGRKTKLRVLWSFDGPIPRPRYRAPSATEVLLDRWITRAQAAPDRRIEIGLRAEVNPQTGQPFGHSTVSRALAEARKRGLIFDGAFPDGRVKRGGGGHGSTYQFRSFNAKVWWRYDATGLRRPPQNVAHGQNRTQMPLGTAVEARFAAQLRPCIKREDNYQTTKDGMTTDFSPQGAVPPPAPPAQTVDQETAQGTDRLFALVNWLKRADLDRLPTAGEKRKLSRAIRLLAVPSVEGVGDSLIDALWWRSHATLRLWNAVVTELRYEAPIGSNVGDLTQWAFALLKRLSGPRVTPQTPGEPGEFDAIFGPGIRREDMEAESKARQAAAVAQGKRAASPSDAAAAACMITDLTEPGDRYTPRPPCPLIPREAFV